MDELEKRPGPFQPCNPTPKFNFFLQWHTRRPHHGRRFPLCAATSTQYCFARIAGRKHPIGELSTEHQSCASQTHIKGVALRLTIDCRARVVVIGPHPDLRREIQFDECTFLSGVRYVFSPSRSDLGNCACASKTKQQNTKSTPEVRRVIAARFEV